CGLFLLARLIACRRDPEARRRAARRVGGVILAGALLAGLPLPLLLHNYEPIRDYYVVNHFANDEKNVRAAEFGVTTRAQFYLYCFRSLRADPGGPVFLGLAAAGAAVALALRVLRAGGPGERRRGGETLAAWFFVGACLAVPYAVLTVNVSKSPVVG